MTIKFFASRYAGTCTTCGGPYAAGDQIAWDPHDRKATKHAACSGEGAARKSAVEASRARDAEIAVPAPPGLAYMPYQRAGIAFALARPRTLIADEMGLGKTVQAIGVINATAAKRVLVICPASLKLNWRNELVRWLVAPATVYVHGAKKPLVTGAGLSHEVHVINYESLKKAPQGPFDIVIVDEAHYCKNPDTQRTKAVKSIVEGVERAIFLTGTPVLNRPVELWPLLQMLDVQTWDASGYKNGRSIGPGEGGGFFRFVRRYCNAHQEYHGGRSHWDFTGASNLPELQEALRSSVMVRRLKSEVLADLPQKTRQLIVIDGPSDDFEPEFTPLADALTVLQNGVKVPFQEMSAIRHASALAKVSAVIDHVTECLEGGSPKIVLFAHHLDVAAQLFEGLAAYGRVMHTGNESVEARQAAVEIFQSDDNCRLFIASLATAKEGITLTAASHVVFAEFDWTPGNVFQAEDRCHRIGQKSNVLVQFLAADRSLDAKIAKTILAKAAVIVQAVDETTAIERSAATAPAESTLTKMTASSTYGLTTPGDASGAGELVYSDAERAKMLEQLRYLAESCDGANQRDGAGFNKLDSSFGKSLAASRSLSQRQAGCAAKLLRKYKKQLRAAELASEAEPADENP